MPGFVGAGRGVLRAARNAFPLLSVLCATHCSEVRYGGSLRASASARESFFRASVVNVGLALAALLAPATVQLSPALALDVQAFNLAKSEQVWYVSEHTLPMIAMTAAIPAGSAYDTKPGLAAFAAALLDQGAGKLNADTFQTALANRGVRLDVSCNRDWLIVSLVTLTDNAKDAFQLLGLALSQPRFDADAIARVREQIFSRLSENQSRPDGVAEDAFYGKFFRDHPYAHPTDGDRTSVSAITAGDLKHFASAHWLGGGLKIAASGDFDQADLTALLKSAFGRLPLKNPPALPQAHGGDPGFHAVTISGPQSVAVFGLPAGFGSDREYTVASIANYILGGGPSARLAASGRDGHTAGYYALTELVANRKGGIMLGEAVAPRGAMHRALEHIRATLKDYAQNGPTQGELDDAKKALTGSFPLSFDSNVATARVLNEVQRVGLGIDSARKHDAVVGAVTLDQVRRAARRLFSPYRLTIVSGEGSSAPRTSSTTDSGR